MIPTSEGGPQTQACPYLCDDSLPEPGRPRTLSSRNKESLVHSRPWVLRVGHANNEQKGLFPRSESHTIESVPEARLSHPRTSASALLPLRPRSRCPPPTPTDRPSPSEGLLSV